MQRILLAQAQKLFMPLKAANKLNSFDFPPSLLKSSNLRKFYLQFICFHLEHQHQKIEDFVRQTQKESSTHQLNQTKFVQALRCASLSCQHDQTKMNLLINITKSIWKNKLIDHNTLTKHLPDGILKHCLQSIKKEAFLILKHDHNNLTIFRNFLLEEHIPAYSNIIELLNTSINPTASLEMLIQLWDQIQKQAGASDLCFLKILGLIMNFCNRREAMKPLKFFIEKYVKQNNSILVENLLKYEYKSCLEEAAIKLEIIPRLVYSFSSNYLEKYVRSNHIIHNYFVIRTVAYLIKWKFVKYTCFFDIMQPSLSLLEKYQNLRLELEQSNISNLFVLKMISEKEEKEKQQKQGKRSQTKKKKLEEQLLENGSLTNSSKLALLTELLVINDFQSFDQIVKEQKIQLDLLLFRPLTETLLQYVQWIIQPLYVRFSLRKYFHKMKSVSQHKFQFGDGYFYQHQKVSKEFLLQLDLLIGILKVFVGSKKTTLTKIIRLLYQINLKKIQINFDVQQQYKQLSRKWTEQYLLPSLSLHQCDPALSNQFFKYLSSTENRFQLYRNTLQKQMLPHPIFFSIFEKVQKDQNSLINKIVTSKQDQTKENVGGLKNCDALYFSVLMSKQLMTRPLIGFYEFFFRRVKTNWQGSIEEFSNAMTNTTELTKDVAMFYVLYTIDSNQTLLLNEEGQMQVIYKNLTALLFKLMVKSQKQLPYFLDVLLNFFNSHISNNQKQKTTNKFLFYHGQLNLFYQLLVFVSPEILFQVYNSQNWKMFSVGYQLRMEISENYEQYVKSQLIRNQLISKLLCRDKNGQFAYINIILSLISLKQSLQESQNHRTIKQTSLVIDQTLTIIRQLANLINNTQNLPQINDIFNLQQVKLLFQQPLPYEYKFQIIRKKLISSFVSVKNENHNQFDQLKQIILKAIEKQIRNKFNQLSGLELMEFVKGDIFMMFWMQSLQTLKINEDSYKTYLKQLMKSFNSKQKSKDKKNITKLQRISQQLDQNLNLKTQFQDRNSFNQSLLIKQQSISYIDYQPKQNTPKFYDILIRLCILPRSLLGKTEAYFSALFLLQILKTNKADIIAIATTICNVIMSAFQVLCFGTTHQSCDYLPPLLCMLSLVFEKWENKQDICEKIQEHVGMVVIFSRQEHIQVIKILEKAHSKILNRILSIKDPFLTTNALLLLQKCDFMPLCWQHGSILQNYFKVLYQEQKVNRVVVFQVEVKMKKRYNWNVKLADNIANKNSKKQPKNYWKMAGNLQRLESSGDISRRVESIDMKSISSDTATQSKSKSLSKKQKKKMQKQKNKFNMAQQQMKKYKFNGK